MNTPSRATTIAGISLDNCILNAAGCWDVTEKELLDLNQSVAGAIVTKSSTINPRKGNPKPRWYYNNETSINSMGVPNMGYKFYMNFPNKYEITKPYIQSIIPFDKKEMIQILTEIDIECRNNSNVKEKKRLIELNLSCPNLINKSVVGTNFHELEQYLDSINQARLSNILLGLKLPPYFELNQWDTISHLIYKSPKVQFITCCNSLSNGLIIDPINETTCIYPKKGMGGIGGRSMKPIALSNVWNFYQRFGDTIDIIGCGGVQSATDVFEHILCGANAVQVGTELAEHGPDVLESYSIMLSTLMSAKQYNNINKFKGKLRVISKES